MAARREHLVWRLLNVVDLTASKNSTRDSCNVVEIDDNAEETKVNIVQTVLIPAPT